jgi:hypothetical protein
MRSLPHRSIRTILLACGCALATSSARAGGSPENILLLVNPASSNSMYLANYYKNARNIPDSNVLYINPFATNYSAFSGANGNIDAVFGKLRTSRIDTHIDYILVTDPASFYVSAPGLVSDSCSPVTRFSISSAYTLSYIRAQILLATGNSTTTQQYNFIAYPIQPKAFDSRTTWQNGSAGSSGGARRYFIGGQLGYTGSNGNTLAEITSVIDRSVAVDGAKPAGTFYYVDNPNDSARNVRSPNYPTAISNLPAGRGALLNTNTPPYGTALPTGQTDVLGIMTGAASMPVDTDPMVILPGAYCDHLTSWGATFDINDQTKISSWLRRGASGASGTVEEPCNYPFKFSHPIFHVYYFAGLSLGESYLRSLAYNPYQSLLQGDPITRPFATLPSVSATPPSGTLSGSVSIPATASTTLSGASISGLDLFVDGVRFAQTTPATPFSLYTGNLFDGPHELRVLAYDNTSARNTGRWIGSIRTDNAGRAVTLSPSATSGTMTTSFTGSFAAAGGTVQEVRLIQNERVIAASASASGAFSFYGRQLGPGVSRVQAEALFSDGRVARSDPVSFNIDFSSGTLSGLAPVAQTFTKRVPRGGPITVELPAIFDDAYVNATYTIVSGPAQATSSAGAGFVTMTAPLTAAGTDTITYRVTIPAGQSNLGTVNIVYTPTIRTALPQQ